MNPKKGGQNKPPSSAKKSRLVPQGYGESHDHFVNHWRKASRGNNESARYLLETFSMTANDGKSIPRPVIAYLQWGISRYLLGEMTLEKSLGLTPPHRKKGSHGNTTDPMQLAARFLLYKDRDKLKPTDAKSKIAKECNTSIRNIERAVANCRLQGLSSTELESIID
ncbi:MAG: hypothetical protein K2Y31_14250 [Burkholderiales bacterium]|nr:hypothetical protein [Burkholderiales bacterium]